MTTRFLAILATITAAFAATSAQAAPQKADDTGYLTGAIGYFDVTQQDNDATLLGAEYRFEPYDYGFRPMVGVFATTDSAVYGYVGFHWDVALLPDELYISPNFAAGAYSAGDDGKRLGGAIEFRSGIELAYQFQNRQRLGIAFNHLSNASIYDRNPGVETLLVTYSIPTGKIF